MMDTPPAANLFGFIALFGYIATLIPTIFRIVFPQVKKSRVIKYLLKYRRQIGVLAFFFAFAHGFLLVRKRNFDFYDLQTYWIYIQGLVTFLIFALLALTSNNWSIRQLKRNWKKLHSLTYLAMFLLTWHIWDKMSSHWTMITPPGLLGVMIISALFVWRKRVEAKPKPKPPSKQSTKKNKDLVSH